MKNAFSVTTILLTFALFTFSAFAKPTPVPFVDLTRYVGLWYELATMPAKFQDQCVARATAQYDPLPNGRIKVLNSCEVEGGKREVAEGRAKVADKKSQAKLKVTFANIGGWFWLAAGDYWVIDLADDYSFVVVGHPKTKYGWVLSRTTSLDSTTWARILESLKKNGYDTCKFNTTIQDGGFSSRVPLCQIFE